MAAVAKPCMHVAGVTEELPRSYIPRMPLVKPMAEALMTGTVYLYRPSRFPRYESYSRY